MASSNISVILPVYNGQIHLHQCLESICSQSIQPLEIIVINDGSTDESASVIQKYNRIDYHFTTNQGVAAARNFGIDKSRGKWIAFIDQDDFWTPDSLKLRMNNATGRSIITGKQEWFLDGISSIPSWVKPELMEKPQDGYLLGCTLINRKLFDEFGMFDTSFRFCSDFDWFFRIKDNGIIFDQIDDIVLHKRIHASNESRHADLSLKELSRAIYSSIQRKRKNQSLHTNQ